MSTTPSQQQGQGRRRSVFRPCIDLHEGKVKQIVGGTLNLLQSAGESSSGALRTNFVSEHPPAYYASLYRQHDLTGGHVIKLGPKNDEAAREALQAWEGGLQVGGGITEANAAEWLAAGASKVIVTSHLFPEGQFSLDRLSALSSALGKESLVVDISCRKRDGGWVVAMNGWKTLTDTWVTQESIRTIEAHCSELLIHAADVEGLCQGIDEDLVRSLGEWVSVPCTYAGGAKDISDLELVDKLSNGKVDLTFGSALDIFGGTGVRFDELVALDQTHRKSLQQ